MGWGGGEGGGLSEPLTGPVVPRPSEPYTLLPAYPSVSASLTLTTCQPIFLSSSLHIPLLLSIFSCPKASHFSP